MLPSWKSEKVFLKTNMFFQIICAVLRVLSQILYNFSFDAIFSTYIFVGLISSSVLALVPSRRQAAVSPQKCKHDY